MTIAITRAVSPRLAECELTYLSRVPMDYELACAQHRAYEAALSELGCRVLPLPVEPDLPDSVFVEDTALVLDELAVLTRPGAASRQPEVASVARQLEAFRSLQTIQAPGTLEGGDILTLGKDIYVGQSGRSNPEGIRQLSEIVAPYGYTVHPTPLTGCLHLKSAVSQVAPGVLLANPAWARRADFPSWDWVEIDPSEPHAANALLIGECAIYPSAFPRTGERLAGRGFSLRLVDVSELQKAEGAVTCCSLVFQGD